MGRTGEYAATRWASSLRGHLVVAAGVLLALLVVRTAAAGLFAETPKGPRGCLATCFGR
jgi:hypothetical protein